MSSNQQWDIVSGVGITALAVAAGRAMETTRTDRLVEDPFAGPLVANASPSTSMKFQDHPMWQVMLNYLAVRSRFFDEFFEQSGRAGQAVILASGLDARAFRLNWQEGLTLFEIDQPLVLEYKDKTLDGLGAEPTCDRHSVAIDLRDDWATALKNAGFDTSVPTAWLAEGLLPYLPAAAEAQLLETVHSFSTPGSSFAIENIGLQQPLLDAADNDTTQEWGIDLEELFSFEERAATPQETLRGLGWSVQEETAVQAGERYGRPLVGLSETMGSEGSFLTATLPA